MHHSQNTNHSNGLHAAHSDQLPILGSFTHRSCSPRNGTSAPAPMVPWGSLKRGPSSHRIDKPTNTSRSL